MCLRGVAEGVGEEVHEDSLQQYWVRRDSRGRRVEGEFHVVRSEVQLVQGRHDGVCWVSGERHDSEGAGLQSAHVEKVGDECGQRAEAFFGGLEELVAVSRFEPVAHGTQSTDGCRRGSERTSQIVTQRREQGPPHSISSRQRCHLIGGVAESSVLQGCRELRDDDSEQPSLGRSEVTPGQFQSRVAADMERGVGAVGDGFPTRGDGVLLVHQTHTGQPECFAGPLDQGLQCPPPRKTLPATICSSSDSAAARRAARVFRAARSTTKLTREAFTTYRTMARKWLGSVIVTV